MTLPPLSSELFVFNHAGALQGDAKTRKLPCVLAACTNGISRARSRLIENCVMLRSVQEKSSPPIGTRVKENPAPWVGSNSCVSTALWSAELRVLSTFQPASL